MEKKKMPELRQADTLLASDQCEDKILKACACCKHFTGIDWCRKFARRSTRNLTCDKHSMMDFLKENGYK